jgi:5'-phosphate synthase pdxT subunit
MKIGVVAFQGAVSEHITILSKTFSKLKIQGSIIEVRKKEDLKDLSGLIIPGGESTTISKLIKKSDMKSEIQKKAEEGMPIFGTCAGCILLAKEGDEEVKKSKTELLNLMDMKITRNAFGRQKESFETQIQIAGLEEPYKAVFIRAPAILDAWGETKILSKYQDKIIMARQNNLLAASFHPELTNDIRVHELFLKMITTGDF